MCGRANIESSSPTLKSVLLNYLVNLPPKSSVLLAPPLLSRILVTWGMGLGLCCWGLKKAWKQHHFPPS